MRDREAKPELEWQSKAILLIVVPWTVVSVLVQGYFWATHVPSVAWTVLGISAVFGLIVWRLRAGTLAAAATGAAITASLMFSTTRFPYEWSWLHGGLLPLLAVFLLTYAATKIGRAKKEKLGTAEAKRGRNAAQVAANLGAAALMAQLGIPKPPVHQILDLAGNIAMPLALAALAEAAADTVSSEIGQVFGGRPRMVTTMRSANPGTDGAITLAGTGAGIIAATAVAIVGSGAFGLGWLLGLFALAGAIFGLFFDSLLGATVERKGWLNNDAVNFLSTFAAALFTGLALAAWLLFMARGVNED